jgi:CBS domain-containing protein
MNTAKRLGDVVALQKWSGASPDTLQWLGTLMSEEGIDLTRATVAQLKRGTAVYATVDADLIKVQRLMARHHILRLPVLDGGKLVGIVDLVELALRSSADQPKSPPPLASAS